MLTELITLFHAFTEPSHAASQGREMVREASDFPHIGCYLAAQRNQRIAHQAR